MTLVFIYDPNSLNPYGGELARVLAKDGVPVKLFSANRGAEYYGNSVRIAGSRPNSFARRVVWVVKRILDPLVFVVNVLRARDSICILVWVKDSWQAVIFCILCRFRVVYLINHNPAGHRTSSGSKEVGPKGMQARLRSAVAALPVHSRSLVRGNSPVVGHPSYAGMVEMEGKGPWVASDGRGQLKLAYIGELRADKGAGALASICSEISRPYELTMLGTAHIPAALLALKRVDGSAIVRHVAGPLSDEELIQELRRADLVVAPYVQPTQSGSLILALTVGVPAIAFSGGAITDILGRSHLVRMGDVIEFANSVDILSSQEKPGWLDTSATMDIKCLESWRILLIPHSERK